MSKRKRRILPTDAENAARQRYALPAQLDLYTRGARPVGLFVTAGLFVAAPLIPSESVATQGTGIPLVMLWLVLLATWWLAGLSRDRTTIRFGWTDLAMVLLVTCHFVSGLVMAWYGNPRHTFNMLWQWVAFGVGYFIVRQLVQTAAECRAFHVLMVALAAALSGLGGYQYVYSMPLQRVEFQRLSEDEKTDRIWSETRLYAPEGSPERMRFADRFASREPLATFALTNSLAGYLAPWLIVTLGIAFFAWTSGRRDLTLFTTLAATAALVGVCLFLTKSRTAALACAGGVPLVILSCRAGGRTPRWLIAAIGGVVVVSLVLVGVLFALKGFDAPLLSGAYQSALYRLQYWRATTALIIDHPLLGCGPGNFQEYYTAYKLPEASETIADPHNFFFEICATAGLPALAFMLAVLGTLAWRIWKFSHAVDVPGTEPTPAVRRREVASPEPGFPLVILLGGLAGIILAAPYGALVGLQLEHLQFPSALRGVPLLAELQLIPAVWVAGLPLAVAVAWLLYPWIKSGTLPVAVPLCGMVVLLVNLLAAGGIGFPGVSQSLWLLLALALNLAPRASEEHSLPRVGVGVLLFTSLGLVWTCHTTAYYPVLVSTLHLERAHKHLADKQYEFAESSAATAATADPYAAEPWEQIVTFSQMKYQFARSQARLETFEQAMTELLRRDAHSARRRLQSGDWYLHAFRQTHEPVLIEHAVAAYQKGVEFYPCGSLPHARLAWAHALAGNAPQARLAAQEALRLDELSPHKDQKLKLQPILDPGPQGKLPAGVLDKPPEPNLELLMRRLVETNATGG